MSIASFVFDLIVLAVLIGCAAYYASKGFLSGMLSFFGTLVSILAAVFLSTRLAPVLFDKLFRPGLEARTMEVIAEQNLGSVGEVVRAILGFLPDSVIESIESGVGTSLDVRAEGVAQYIVSEVVAPLVIPIISAILFFALFMALRLLIGLLSKVLAGANKLPVIGTLNGALGAVIGVLIGALYVFLLVCVLWALDAIYTAGTIQAEYLRQSLVLRLLGGVNFFL